MNALCVVLCQRSQSQIVGDWRGDTRALLLVVSAWRAARELCHMISPQYDSRLLRGP